jgi:hypothetical protein
MKAILLTSILLSVGCAVPIDESLARSEAACGGPFPCTDYAVIDDECRHGTVEAITTTGATRAEWAVIAKQRCGGMGAAYVNLQGTCNGSGMFEHATITCCVPDPPPCVDGACAKQLVQGE